MALVEITIVREKDDDKQGFDDVTQSLRLGEGERLGRMLNEMVSGESVQIRRDRPPSRGGKDLWTSRIFRFNPADVENLSVLKVRIEVLPDEYADFF